MLFRFLILVHVCTAFPLKCPEPAQWSTRARGFCPDPSKYFCLKNDLINGYSENCTIFDFLQPGRKHVLRGGLDADICSSERYQPWPINFYTNVSTNCIFLKSACNEEGQVIYDNGNRNTDITCRCDYTRGYDFIVKPRNRCFCVPSEEDCSCHLKTCHKATDKLSSDYKCLHAENNITVSECKPIINERIITASNDTEFISRREHISNNVQMKMMLIAICFGFTIAYCIGVMIFELCWKVLVIYEPPSDTQLIEGQTVELKYKLLINRRPSSFLKNHHFLPASKHIEKNLDGLWKILKITSVTPDDVGEYCLEVAGYRSRITNLFIQPMFTSKIQKEHHCTEGDSIKLTCSVYTDNIKVKWYKGDNELHECTHISITSHGNHRMLTIVETEVTDSGTYFVKAQSVVLEMSLTVKAIFKRRLVDMTNMEGLDTNLECETVERNCNVQWFKDNVEIINQLDKVKIKKTKGRIHTLFISKTSLEDSGTYSIQIKGVKSIAKLDVKEMPETIKLMSIRDKEEFLKAAKSGLTKRYAVRVMIVGEKSVGKTCLLRRLINEQISDVNSTDGITIERGKCQIDIETGEWHFLSDDREPQASSDHIKQFADCGFWDFAGQKEFYATHQTFLSANAVYLLVVDISKDLTMKTYNNMIEKEFDAIGEYIDFWLDNIHSYSRDEMNTPKDHKEDHFINPPVIIVGTRIDKLEEVEEKKKNFQHYLSRILSTHVKRRHLRKVHFVSNTRPSDDKQEFKSLREDIFRHAKVLTTWGENIPTRWIVLEKVINTKPSEHVISYTDAENLAMKSSFHNDSQMTLELDSFLKFEHNIGNIIFFEDVRSFIVLDPKWLMDIFRCFVSHQYDDDTIGMPEWSELEQTGKLAYKLIEKLLEKVPDLSTPELKKYVLQIMEKFDIIVRPMNDDAKNDFYMPCMIKVEPFLNIIERSESKNYRRTSWFCLKFNFLPPSYFNHILVSFVKRKELFVEKNRRLCIYRNIGEFQLNKSGSQTLVVCLSKNAIGMQVRQLNCTEDICFSDVKNILMDIVNSVKQRYGINIAYTIKFKCSEGIYNCKRVDLETLMDIDEYLCKEHETMHTSKGIYSSWLTEEEVDLESKKKSHRRCNYCKNMSVHKCYDCNQVLCEDCLRRHESMYQSHSMQPISDSFILNCIFPLEDVNHGNRLIRDIKCLPDGEVVAAVENKNLAELMVFSISGKRRHVIQLDTTPRAMNVVDKNTVSVLIGNDSVAIVDIQQNHVQYIRNFSNAYSSNAFIYIENEFCIGDTYCIVVIDMSGSVKRRITLSFKPYDMCYDVDSKRIYCINRYLSELVCIDRDGNNIFTFTLQNMINQTDLTLDNDGNVLVLCIKRTLNSGYSVIKVDSNGEKGEVVITNIETPRFEPCICYDHLTDSVVIALNDKVYIYKKKMKV